jgi:predicted MFS family arabinose efflux permease
MPPTPAAPAPPRERWYVLSVLTCAYALNIADRFSISTVIEPLRAELKLSDTRTALLTGGALALFYVTVGIPVAGFADRANRKRILAWALAVWSAMTALCALAQGFWQLLLARFGVGIGEAGGTPPSTSILADNFPPARRPFALTIFALGACLGAWLGSAPVGAVAERDGWRAAFLFLGLPGLALAAVVAFTVREPRRGALDSRPPAERTGFTQTLRYVHGARSALHLIIGASLATLWSWGLMWWTPAFLQRSHHLTVGQAGALLGPMHLWAGTASTLVAGWLMGLNAATDPRYVARLLAVVVAVSTIPSLLVYCAPTLASATVLLWLFVPGVYFYIGPVLGLLQNVTPAAMRATACALLLFLANIGNLVIAPLVVGGLSDAFRNYSGATDEQSLRWGLLILAPTGFWAAVHLWLSGRSIRADEARASG